MSKLIDELKRDHVLLVTLLEEVKAHGLMSDIGKNTLIQTKNLLLAHLKKEDRELYPALRKAAEKDLKLKASLDIFAKDMEEISKNAIDFFTTYSQGGEGIKFAGDWGKLYATISARLRREESNLYNEYEKLGFK